MDSIDRAVLDKEARGWQWVRDEFARLREKSNDEAERLLGPDRGW